VQDDRDEGAGNRRIAGWSFAVTLHTQLVLDALNYIAHDGLPEGRHPSLGSRLAVLERL
jgi:hypothetical protein